MVAAFAIQPSQPLRRSRQATACQEALKGKNADYGSDKQKETKSAKALRNQQSAISFWLGAISQIMASARASGAASARVYTSRRMVGFEA